MTRSIWSLKGERALVVVAKWKKGQNLAEEVEEVRNTAGRQEV